MRSIRSSFAEIAANAALVLIGVACAQCWTASSKLRPKLLWKKAVLPNGCTAYELRGGTVELPDESIVDPSPDVHEFNEPHNKSLYGFSILAV